DIFSGADDPVPGTGRSEGEEMPAGPEHPEHLRAPALAPFPGLRSAVGVPFLAVHRDPVRRISDDRVSEVVRHRRQDVEAVADIHGYWRFHRLRSAIARSRSVRRIGPLTVSSAYVAQSTIPF